MNSLSLCFNEVKLNPVTNINDGQIWLTSSELAQALGYKSSKSVSNLYNANSDEFTSKMTEVIESVTSGNYIKKTRIFSLRGCHLIAMFARTKVAKQFRKWVLDILDKEVGTKVVTTTKDDRTPLKNAVNMLVGKTNLSYSEAYRMVHQYMGVQHIDEIAKDDLPKAIEYVHRLTLGMDAQFRSLQNIEETKRLALRGWHTASQNSDQLRELCDTMTAMIATLQKIKANNATHHSTFEMINCLLPAK